MAAREPVWRSKAVFWALVVAFVTLASVPSVVLVQSLERYLRFLSGYDPGVLRPTKTGMVPHRGPATSTNTFPTMRFVEFKLRAPKAKQVFLAGNFNRWSSDLLPLSKGKNGLWETMLPLPPGRYSYLFQVDGEWTADPAAPHSGAYEGRPASLMEVQ